MAHVVSSRVTTSKWKCIESVLNSVQKNRRQWSKVEHTILYCTGFCKVFFCSNGFNSTSQLEADANERLAGTRKEKSEAKTEYVTLGTTHQCVTIVAANTSLQQSRIHRKRRRTSWHQRTGRCHHALASLLLQHVVVGGGEAHSDVHGSNNSR